MKDRNENPEGIAVFPRSIARGMAKAEIGSSRLSKYSWRQAAAARSGKQIRTQKGARHAERSE